MFIEILICHSISLNNQHQFVTEKTTWNSINKCIHFHPLKRFFLFDFIRELMGISTISKKSILNAPLGSSWNVVLPFYLFWISSASNYNQKYWNQMSSRFWKNLYGLAFQIWKTPLAVQMCCGVHSRSFKWNVIDYYFIFQMPWSVPRFSEAFLKYHSLLSFSLVQFTFLSSHVRIWIVQRIRIVKNHKISILVFEISAIHICRIPFHLIESSTT